MACKEKGSVILCRKPLCRNDTLLKGHFAECDTLPKYCPNLAKMPKKMLKGIFYIKVNSFILIFACIILADDTEFIN